LSFQLLEKRTNLLNCRSSLAQLNSNRNKHSIQRCHWRQAKRNHTEVAIVEVRTKMTVVEKPNFDIAEIPRDLPFAIFPDIRLKAIWK